ncbi:hypothetical protein [Nocardioides sp. YIM 152315]|uniref:hypothetical protein n=1 Tax=Nocardioides sp. YIM 152315 TaxID=3031760 RepID=UPI0023DC12BF|nr:hypothetical protein [Nocardioides sp. YIM 152315]MDF1602071.1 hypothetical protein [Nocardioides sp. YIM 152315]
MESEDIRRTLREADRAEAAPWTDYPPTPRWYPAAVGVWAALITLAFTELDDPVRLPAVLALVAVELGFLRWYVRYRNGVMPTGRAPREFRRAILGFVAGAAIIVLGVGALVSAVDAWAGAAFALVVVPGAIAWYERAYADAARRARKRLS